MENELNLKRNKIKHQRKNRGWSQQHLAEVSGLSLRTIQRAEKSHQASNETISALSSVFEIVREQWFEQPIEYKASFVFKKRAWKIALISIIIFQLFALMAVYLALGGVSAVWLKILFITDGVIFLFWGLFLFMHKTHEYKM